MRRERWYNARLPIPIAVGLQAAYLHLILFHLVSMRNRFVLGLLSLLVVLQSSSVEAQEIRLGISGIENKGDGVLITQVMEGFVGHRANLQSGDVIIAIDGKQLTSLRDYADAVAKVGGKAEMIVRKADSNTLVTVTLVFVEEKEETILEPQTTLEPEPTPEIQAEVPEAPIVPQPMPEDTGEGRTHLIVFAPNQFEHFWQPPEFQNGMRMLVEQCQQSGVVAQNTVVLHGESSDPNRLGLITNLRRELGRLASVSPKDRILLFVLTHGIHINGNDYLADQKTTADGLLQAKEDELISVREIVDVLGKSTASHCLIVIDSATLDDPVKNFSSIADETFGTAPLSSAENRVVMFNRGRTIHLPHDKTYVCSVFMRSFLDAVSTEDSSAKEEKQVSLTQMLDAMQRFLRTEDQPAPWMSGSFTNDAVLLPSRKDAVGIKPVPSVWNYSIAQGIETAAKLVFLYHRPQDAEQLLRQVERQLEAIQNRDPQFQTFARQAKILRHAARGMLGELDAVWRESQQDDIPLYLYVVNPPDAARNLQGRLVQVSGFSGRNNETVEFNRVWQLSLDWQENADPQREKVIKVNFVSVGGDGSQLPRNAFTLGTNASPIGPQIESMMGKRP